MNNHSSTVCPIINNDSKRYFGSWPSSTHPHMWKYLIVNSASHMKVELPYLSPHFLWHTINNDNLRFEAFVPPCCLQDQTISSDILNMCFNFYSFRAVKLKLTLIGHAWCKLLKYFFVSNALSDPLFTLDEILTTL